MYTVQRLVNLMVHCIGTIPTISLTISIIQTDKWKRAGLVNPYWLVNKADQRLNRCQGPVTQAIFHKTNFDETNDSIWNSRIMLKAWWIADILCEMRKTVEASQMSNFITKEDRTVKFTFKVLNCFTLWSELSTNHFKSLRNNTIDGANGTELKFIPNSFIWVGLANRFELGK